MSITWYECKVKYRKIDENSGEQKLKTEPYLVDAVSYTEAESRITEEMMAYLSDNDGIKITNIKVANFAEIHPFENADRWFKCKISLIAYDEESGKERKTNQYLLIQANDVKEAYENTLQVMQNTMGDFTIPAIAESPIMDVFPYFSEDDKGSERVERFNTIKNSVPTLIGMDEEAEMADVLQAAEEE